MALLFSVRDTKQKKVVCCVCRILLSRWLFNNVVISATVAGHFVAVIFLVCATLLVNDGDKPIGLKLFPFLSDTLCSQRQLQTEIPLQHSIIPCTTFVCH